ncbi:MAG: IS630 family transposase, partial [Cyanobacteria bacterium J06642_2]
NLTVEFIHLPAYSHQLNLAEYLIHQVRLKLLHHLPLGTTLDEIELEIEAYLHKQHLQTPQQIQNTVNHICKLATQS